MVISHHQERKWLWCLGGHGKLPFYCFFSYHSRYYRHRSKAQILRQFFLEKNVWILDNLIIGVFGYRGSTVYVFFVLDIPCNPTKVLTNKPDDANGCGWSVTCWFYWSWVIHTYTLILLNAKFVPSNTVSRATFLFTHVATLGVDTEVCCPVTVVSTIHTLINIWKRVPYLEELLLYFYIIHHCSSLIKAHALITTMKSNKAKQAIQKNPQGQTQTRL